ncbi:hypothetical protein [Streptomyces sp. NPDC048659]|uniref:hypothetical protein n=1 Tax=Streptomyces sp. NPDC048659 TaxID=3155489 RepID=UPI003427C047
MSGDRIADLCQQLQEVVGEDPQREGLQSTPQRFARWWTEFLDHDLGGTDTVFEEDLAAGTDRVVADGGTLGIQLLAAAGAGQR